MNFNFFTTFDKDIIIGLIYPSSDRQKLKETFQGFKVPVAAVAIPLYLGHSSTRDLYKCMVELAMNKVVLGPKEMANLSREYVKRLHLKNGHRLQIFKKFQRRHYFETINKGAARFPYMGVMAVFEIDIEVSFHENGLLLKVAIVREGICGYDRCARNRFTYSSEEKFACIVA